MSRIKAVIHIDAGLMAKAHWYRTNEHGEHYICFNSWGNSLWIKTSDPAELRAAAHELNRLANVFADEPLQGLTVNG
jgi:hypothetical protein